MCNTISSSFPLGIKIAAGFPTAKPGVFFCGGVIPLTYLNTRKSDFYMEYRNIGKSKSETRKKAGIARIFLAFAEIP